VEAICVTLGLAVLTVAIPVALSFRPLPCNSIIVGTNSAAISAQLHPDMRQANVQIEQKAFAEERPWLALWLRLLQWGVLVEGSTDPKRPGRLGLAPSRYVLSKPQDGHYYQ